MAEMTQQNAPVTEAPAPAAPPARPSGTSNQKKKQRKKVQLLDMKMVQVFKLEC